MASSLAHINFNVRGSAFRVATPEEIKELQSQEGAPHVLYGCTLCGKAHWSAKNLTLADDGRFVAVRNIFFNGEYPECDCAPSHLRCIVRDD